MSEENSTVEFDLDLAEEPIVLKKKDSNGAKVDRPCTLRELDGKKRDEFVAFIGTKARYDAEGKPSGMKNMDGLHARLIHLSLWDNSTGKQIPESEIQTWSATVQKALFEKCQKLSGLENDAEDKAKNA